MQKNNRQFTYGQTVQKTTTTNNLHMDRQCKKNKKTIYIWTDSAKKTTDNLHMDRQCKKNNRQFTYGQTVQKKSFFCSLELLRALKRAFVLRSSLELLRTPIMCFSATKQIMRMRGHRCSKTSFSVRKSC